MVAAKSAMVRLVTIGVTVWLMQRYRLLPPCARRSAALFRLCRQRRYCDRRRRNHLLFLASGRCRSAGCYRRRPPAHPAELSAVHCLGAMLRRLGRRARLRPSGCGSPRPRAAALVMAAGMAMVLIYLSDRLPFPTAGLPGWKIAMVIGFPVMTAMVYGGCVPHIYRAARRAASIRREEASQFVAPTGSLKPLAPEDHRGGEAADAPQSGKPETGSHGRHPVAFRHAAPRNAARARITDGRQAPATTGQSPATDAMTDDGVTQR